MTAPRQTILMCAPDFFGVDYVINPWMENQLGKADPALATRQWQNLRDRLAAHADLVFVRPERGVPDQVFTANAGLVLGKKVVVSRFRSKERQPEEPFFQAWFAQNHFDIVAWPRDILFEGAGDCLMDRGQSLIWAGQGFRSDAAAPALIEKIMQRRTESLHLVDPRFYHLDTCFCPLEGGWLLYYPPAFDQESQAKIAALVPEAKRVVAPDEDAMLFACNACDLDRKVFTNHASEALQAKLRAAGFTPVICPVSEFHKAGGGVKCLTLKLVEA